MTDSFYREFGNQSRTLFRYRLTNCSLITAPIARSPGKVSDEALKSKSPFRNMDSVIHHVPHESALYGEHQG